MRAPYRHSTAALATLGGLRRYVCCSPLVRRPLPPPPSPPVTAQHVSHVRTTASAKRKLRAGKLPPPPPLPSAAATSSTVRVSGRGPSFSAADAGGQEGGADAVTTPSAGTSAGLSWAAPQEVLSTMVEYIPTFFVPIQSVAAILEDENLRAHVTGRGRFMQVLRRFPFLFELRQPDVGGGYRAEVRLHSDVDHPRRGVADDKYMMTDVGESTFFVAKPEYVVWNESIEQPAQQNVWLSPVRAPPAVHVCLEDRPPVLEKLIALIPADFTAIDLLEDTIPESILFDPFFDCQGGLAAIVGKFPEAFQLVGEKVRRRPPYLAPLALDELTLARSPLPDVAALVEREVCQRTIPHWVSVTSLYEQLTPAQRQALKQHGFRSLSGFLRAHGRSVAVAQDMLSVSMWMSADTPPPPIGDTSETVSTPANATSQVEDKGRETSASGARAGTAHRGHTHREAAREKHAPRSPREALAALEAEAEDAYLADAYARQHLPPRTL